MNRAPALETKKKKQAHKKNTTTKRKTTPQKPHHRYFCKQIFENFKLSFNLVLPGISCPPY